MVTGVKNSSTAAHAGRKSRIKWIPGASGYSWATLHRGVKNTVIWPSRLGAGRRVDNLSKEKANC
jgi:hypothetical protein